MKDKILKFAEDIANHKHAMHWLFIWSFADSFIFPFPAYFLILFILSHKVKHSWQKVSFVATISSVLGGMLGYAIGYYFYKFLGQPIIHFYGLEESFTHFGEKIKDNSFWVLILAGMTPLPYKITTITAGVFAVNFPIFVLTSVISRGIKFVIVSYITQKFGPKMREAASESLWSTIITFIVILFLIYHFLIK